MALPAGTYPIGGPIVPTAAARRSFQALGYNALGRAFRIALLEDF